MQGLGKFFDQKETSDYRVNVVSCDGLQSCRDCYFRICLIRSIIIPAQCVYVALFYTYLLKGRNYGAVVYTVELSSFLNHTHCFRVVQQASIRPKNHLMFIMKNRFEKIKLLALRFFAL